MNRGINASTEPNAKGNEIEPKSIPRYPGCHTILYGPVLITL